jgi:hypothetical protein
MCAETTLLFVFADSKKDNAFYPADFEHKFSRKGLFKTFGTPGRFAASPEDSGAYMEEQLLLVLVLAFILGGGKNFLTKDGG